MVSSQRNRLYLVFVHYGLSREQDWDWIHRRLTIKYDAVTRLTGDLAYLRHVLKPRSSDDGQLWEGFAFIFLDPGWSDLLEGAPGMHKAQLGAELTYFRNQIEDSLGGDKRLKSSGPPRERIVTAGHLIYLLQLLDETARSRERSFYSLFVGGTHILRYDAPKVIEAAIRIANIGGQLPLFRFDDDVLFYGQRLYGQRSTTYTGDKQKWKESADSTAENILRLCNRYHTLSIDPRIYYFVYSGGYNPPTELRQDPDKIDPDAFGHEKNNPGLINGFATRVLQLTEIPPERYLELEDNCPGVVRSCKVVTFLKELYTLGANPFRQVVSGAGLCLSDSAILDLPPYSNMHLNVMWIDDHLKYAIHDELGHFGRWTRSHHPYVARVSKACFSQMRHVKKGNRPLFTYRDVRWHIQKYMLRLILGCVADSWLRKKPESKLGTKTLNVKKYKKLAESVPHIFASKFMDVLPGGWLEINNKGNKDGRAKSEFKQKLWQEGCQRLKKLVTIWGDKKYEDTFLGLFVMGDSHSRYKEYEDYFPKGMPCGLKKAVGELPKQYKEAEKVPPGEAPDEPRLEEALVRLIDNFVEYLSLVQFWPFFAQSVRYFLNQHALFQRPDLEWMFPVIPED